LGWLPGEVPAVTITDESGYGVGAIAEAVMACNDSNICYVESITITDAGQFYYLLEDIIVDISLPTDPGGTPALAKVELLDDCGTFTVPDCDGTANPTTYQLWGGEQYAINVCAGSPGPEGFKYTITPNPVDVSCCDCFKYDVINTGLEDSIDYNYTDCLDQTIKTVTIQAQETQQVCAVVSSVWPVDAASNQFFEYIVSATQDC
jgi:hypothetical protein